MSDRLIEFMAQGPEKDMWWPAVGLPIPHAPHFVVTDFFMSHRRLADLLEIGRNPALTHLKTGCHSSQALESLEQAHKIAVVLEALPIPWDGTAGEILGAVRALPPALRRWLREEVCGFPPRKKELR
jgi:hypothetical protein